MQPIHCPISPEELSRLYTEEKLTDQQIVEHLGEGATLKRVRSWRRRFKIVTLDRASRNEVAPIEGNLKSLLVGSMLGDGRISKSPRAARYSENHCKQQRPYLEWKAEQWGPWQSPGGIKPVLWKTNGQEYKGYRFHTVSHPSLRVWHELFYPEPASKQLKPAVVDLVDARALAIWYMDDGSAQWWPLITFGMSLASRDIALRILEKFGFAPRWSEARGLTGQLIFDGEEQAERFISLIKPHMPECMLYKLQFGFQGRYYDIRKVTPEPVLRQMAGQGIPIQKMAQVLGLSSSVVSRRLERLGVEHPRTVGRPPARTSGRR